MGDYLAAERMDEEGDKMTAKQQEQMPEAIWAHNTNGLKRYNEDVEVGKFLSPNGVKYVRADYIDFFRRKDYAIRELLKDIPHKPYPQGTTGAKDAVRQVMTLIEWYQKLSKEVENHPSRGTQGDSVEALEADLERQVDLNQSLVEREAQLLEVIRDLDWQISCAYITSKMQIKHAAIITEASKGK